MSAISGELVSVVVPFYSHPEYLPHALQSILEQTYTHLEIIVVDDGSPHDLTPHIQPYLSDSRLRVVRQENKGVAAARNTGIQASQGAYFQFLDSDDWLSSEKIACQVRALEAHPDVGLVFCPCHYVEGNMISEPIDLHRDPLWQPADGCYFNSLWAANRMVVSAPLVRREWIERSGGFDTGNLTEDYELWLRLAALGCKMRSLPDAHVYYRINPQGRSRDGYARTRKVATRARILSRFPELSAAATEQAMETWNASWAALWRRQQDTIEGQQDTIEGQQDTIEGQQDTIEGQQGTVERQQDTIAQQQDTIAQQQDTIAQQQEAIEHQAEELVQARHDLEHLRRQITDCTGLLHEQDAIINHLEQAPPKRVIIRGLRQLILPIGTRRYAVYAQIRRSGNTRRT